LALTFLICLILDAAEVVNKTGAANTTKKPTEAANTIVKPTEEAKPEPSTEAPKQDTPKPELAEIECAETSGVKHPEALVLLVAFLPLSVLFI
jgi:hypothetical protein